MKNKLLRFFGFVPKTKNGINDPNLKNRSINDSFINHIISVFNWDRYKKSQTIITLRLHLLPLLKKKRPSKLNYKTAYILMNNETEL